MLGADGGCRQWRLLSGGRELGGGHVGGPGGFGQSSLTGAGAVRAVLLLGERVGQFVRAVALGTAHFTQVSRWRAV